MAEPQGGGTGTAPEPTVRLWDGTSQSYVQVPNSQAALAIKDPTKGQGFKPGDSYYFQYPDGELGKASNVNEFYSAIKSGGREIDKRTAELRNEARGAIGTATAFGSSALSSATFGGTDILARGLDELSGNKFGITERIKASQEASPIASTLGNVTGAVGSAALLPGGGLVGGVGRLAAGAVERAAGGALTGLAAKGTLGAIASSGAKLAATGALEGAAQGVGQTISQQALQSTPQGIAESLVANVGTGVLFGGVIGGGLGAGGKALAPVIGTAGKAFTQVTGKLKGFSGEELAAQRGVFEPGSEALKALRSPQKFEEQVANSTSKLMNDIEKTGISASTKMNEMITGSTTDPIKGQAAKNVVLDHMGAMSQDPSLSPKVKGVFTDLNRKLSPMAPEQLEAIQTQIGVLEKKLATPLTAAEKESIQSQADILKNRLVMASPENSLQALREARRDVSEAQRDFQRAYTMTGDREAGQGLKQLDSLNKVLKTTVWDEATFGPQAGLLADLDEAIATRYSAFNALKDSGAIKKEGAGFVLKRNGVKALLRDEKNASLIEDLLAAEHKVQAVGSQLSGEAMDATISELPKMIQARQTVRSLFDNELMTGRSLWAGGLGYAAGGPAGAFVAHALENPGTVTKFLANRYSDSLKLGKLVDKENSWGVLQGIASSLNRQAADEATSRDMQAQAQRSTEQTASKINAHVSSLLSREAKGVVAPAVQYTAADFTKTKEILASPPPAHIEAIQDPVLKASLITQHQLVTGYLNSKLPPVREDSLGFERPPTKQQLLAYGRTVEAANNPLKVIEDIGKGYVSREGLDTLQAVYPALYEALQQQVKGTITDEPSLKNKAVIAQIIGREGIATRAKASMEGWATAFVDAAQDQATGGLDPHLSQGMGMGGPKLKGIGAMGVAGEPKRGSMV